MIHSAVCVLEKYLFVQQVHCQLKANSPHVCLLKGGSEVHVDVHEPLGFALGNCQLLLRLLRLHLIEEGEEPLERLLVPVDPEKVNLFQVVDGVCGRQVLVPLEVTPRTTPFYLSLF